MGVKKENKRPIIILPYFMQIHVPDTKATWRSRFYRETTQVPLSSKNKVIMQTCQSALLLFKHQHNLLCPHLKSSRVVGLQERSTDNKRSALSAEAFVTTPPQSPPRSSNTQWRPTPLFRGNQKMVSMILFFIQLDIILVFAPLIERICSHYIHTYVVGP